MGGSACGLSGGTRRAIGFVHDKRGEEGLSNTPLKPFKPVEAAQHERAREAFGSEAEALVSS